MATTAEYVAAQNGAVRLALRDLRRFWRSLDQSDPIAVRDALERFWPELIATYGEVVVTLAADRFEELTNLPAEPVRPVDPERANERMRWGITPLFSGNGDALALLALLLDELVKQPGRSTLTRSTARHRLAYVRVPMGANTCDFCLGFAARGPIRGNPEDARAFHGNCVVEGTMVSGPRAVAATSRMYEGEVVTLSAGGHNLSVTPNHPILTGRGWVAAEFVNEFDHLFVTQFIDGVVAGGPDVYDGPARVEERFVALAMERESARRRVPGAAQQFHGDGFDAEVDVVIRDGLLGNELHAAGLEEVAQRGFAIGAGVCARHRRALATLGHSGPLDSTLLGAPDGFVRGEGLGRALLGGHASGFHPGGFTAAADWDRSLDQPSPHNVPRNPQRSSDGVFTFPGEVAASEVVRGLESVASPTPVDSTARDVYVGHVYNLSTAPRWYAAESIVTHNCNCRVEPIRTVSDEERLRSEGYDPDKFARQLRDT